MIDSCQRISDRMSRTRCVLLQQLTAAIGVLTFLGSIGVAVCGVELTISPTGPILEGSTVLITCRAPGKMPLDVLRLVRVVNGIPHDITTNELVNDGMKKTGRYRVIKYEDNQGLVQLEISHIRGVDGGNIGCRLLSQNPTGDSAFSDLIVNVPARSVQLLHQSGESGDVNRAADGERLRLRHGQPTTLTCRVEVTETDFQPKITVTLGGKDATSRFTPNVTRHRLARTGDGGAVATSDSEGTDRMEEQDTGVDVGLLKFKDWRTDYEMKIDANNVSTMDGQNWTCTAVMPHFAALSTSVLIQVAYKPQLTCDALWSGRLGQVNYNVTCFGRMNPPPRQVIWSWGLTSDGDRVEIYNGGVSKHEFAEVYKATQVEETPGHHELRLSIAELQLRDFRSYTLEVTNEIGTTSKTFELRQVFTTTDKRPSTMRADVSDGKHFDSVYQQPAAGRATRHLANAVELAAVVMVILLGVCLPGTGRL